MKTRVILRKDVSELGFVGDVVEVTAGFARNYLLPHGLAWPHNDDYLRRIEKARIEAEAQRLQQMKEFEALAAKLGELQLTFEKRVGDGGHLYGSVNAAQVAEALQEQGYQISERQVRLGDPIRQVGEHPIAVHLHGEIEATVKVWVVAEEASE